MMHILANYSENRWTIERYAFRRKAKYGNDSFRRSFSVNCLYFLALPDGVGS